MLKWLERRLKQRQRRQRLDAEYEKPMMNTMHLELKASKHSLHSFNEKRKLEKAGPSNPNKTYHTVVTSQILMFGVLKTAEDGRKKREVWGSHYSVSSSGWVDVIAR